MRDSNPVNKTTRVNVQVVTKIQSEVRLHEDHIVGKCALNLVGASVDASEREHL